MAPKAQSKDFAILDCLGGVHWPASLFASWRLTLPRSGTVALLGASGIGKSSLFEVLLSFSKGQPQQGFAWQLNVCDQAQPLRLSLLRQNTGLLPWLSAVENVVLRDKVQGLKPDYSAAAVILDKLGFDAHEKAAKPVQLSGGQAQRVGLARILYEQADIVLLDEPFSALDWPRKQALQQLFAKELKGKLTLLITHDPYEALQMADSCLVLAGKPAGPQLTLNLQDQGLRDVTSLEHSRAIKALIQALGKDKLSI